MNYARAVEVIRGGLVESVHFAAAAVVTSDGELVANLGNPETVTFLRSSAKPFQAIPLITSGAAKSFSLTDQEIALVCASHTGTDEHVKVARGILSKIGVAEAALQCGSHPRYDQETTDVIKAEGFEPIPIRHNCSGKHAGMLAQAVHRQQTLDSYLEIDSEVQVAILQALAELTGVKPAEIKIGVNGCSAPNFALPLSRVALAYANIVDPGRLPTDISHACRKIYHAMTSNPDMVSGEGRFDTRIMEVTGGRLLSKGGAEGYQGFGIISGGIEEGSPAIGIAIKIADGGSAHHAGAIANLSILQEIGALSETEILELEEFGPYQLVTDNGLEVGEIVSKIKLENHTM